MFKKILISLLVASTLLVCQAITASEPNESDILVFGGTGRLGSEIVKALVDQGHTVTVFARATSNLGRLEGLPINYVIGDVLVATSVEQAFAGNQFDVAIDALGRGSSGVEFYKISAENIAQSATANEVKQIILHGSVGAGNSAGEAGGFQKLFTAKTAGENAVINSGISYTIIRNGHLIRYGAGDNGNALLYDDVSMSGSVTRAALGRLTTDCILSEKCKNKIFHAIDKTWNKH